jgi:hypothetical protein
MNLSLVLLTLERLFKRNLRILSRRRFARRRNPRLVLRLRTRRLFLRFLRRRFLERRRRRRRRDIFLRRKRFALRLRRLRTLLGRLFGLLLPILLHPLRFLIEKIPRRSTHLRIFLPGRTYHLRFISVTLFTRR